MQAETSLEKKPADLSNHFGKYIYCMAYHLSCMNLQYRIGKRVIVLLETARVSSSPQGVTGN